MKIRLNKNLITNYIEIHNSISAKIAQYSGFKCLWVSGLTLSSSFGFSDRNELSWESIIKFLNYIKNHINIPLLIDCDSGFGNIINVIRLVKTLKKYNINSICLEDKLFPKINSFINSNHNLISTKEFCKKIYSVKIEGGKNFSIIARTEILISGGTIIQALKKSYKYYLAGADAILIHSKIKNFNEIKEFKKKWNLIPVFIIPTKYFNLSLSDCKLLNIKNIIWANHLMRSNIKIMNLISKRIFLDKSLVNIEKNIITLSELFLNTNEKNINKIENILFYI